MRYGFGMDAIDAYATELEYGAERRGLSDALGELEAAASKVRRLLGESVRRRGYRWTADASGLPLGTVQRWRYEVPPSPTLRAAQSRRERR